MTVRFSVALSLLLASPFAGAQPIDPLWQRAQETMQASKDLVSSEVAVDTVVEDENGNNLDTIHKTTRLAQWKDNQPIRTVLSMTETKKSGLGELKFEWGVANHPEQGLMDGSVVRGATVAADGKTCILFYVEGKKGKLPFKSTVWVEEATGLPLKADYVVDGIPMAKSMTYSVLFGRDENARWLPREVTMDTFMSALFYKFKIHSKQRFSHWVGRPAAPG